MMGDVVIPRPNGIIVHGFAESDEAIHLYLEELKKAQRLLPNNWYVSIADVIFSQASVQRVAWDVLYNAPTDGNVSGRTVAPGASSLYSFSLEAKLRYTQNRPDTAQQQARTGGGG